MVELKDCQQSETEGKLWFTHARCWWYRFWFLAWTRGILTSLKVLNLKLCSRGVTILTHWIPAVAPWDSPLLIPALTKEETEAQQGWDTSSAVRSTVSSKVRPSDFSPAGLYLTNLRGVNWGWRQLNDLRNGGQDSPLFPLVLKPLQTTSRYFKIQIVNWKRKCTMLELRVSFI